MCWNTVSLSHRLVPGVSNNINVSSVLFRCPSKSVSLHTQYQSPCSSTPNGIQLFVMLFYTHVRPSKYCHEKVLLQFVQLSKKNVLETVYHLNGLFYMFGFEQNDWKWWESHNSSPANLLPPLSFCFLICSSLNWNYVTPGSVQMNVHRVALRRSHDCDLLTAIESTNQLSRVSSAPLQASAT